MQMFEVGRYQVAFACAGDAHQMVSTLQSGLSKSGERGGNAASATNVLFLGFSPDGSFSAALPKISTSGFVVSIYGPSACSMVNSGENGGGLIFVDPSPLGVATLAKVLGYQWPTQQKDLKILAGLSGASRSDPEGTDPLLASMLLSSSSILTAHDTQVGNDCQPLSTIFSRFPAMTAATLNAHGDSLWSVVSVFLRTLGAETPKTSRAKKTLQSWIAKTASLTP
jgi:hypothetical protein